MFFFFIIRRPPRATRSDTHLPDTTRVRSRPPRIARALKSRFHFRLQAIELLPRKRRPSLTRIIDQSPRWPRRIIQQRLVPNRRCIVDCHRPGRRTDTANTIGLAPYGAGPFGQYGGYYYGRISLDF